jgi:hypothetical protein
MEQDCQLLHHDVKSGTVAPCIQACYAALLNSNYVGYVPTDNSMGAATSNTACGFACQPLRVASHRSFSDIIVVLFNTIFLNDMVTVGLQEKRYKVHQVCVFLWDILHAVLRTQLHSPFSHQETTSPAELKHSTPLTPKPANGYHHEADPSTCHPHNLFP